MTPEKKKNRRLRNLALLSLLVFLVGGTYAFRSFNQQAINDRERDHDVNVGGRIHDYYNRDTENKDVFVENYGERPIMARIRLSEYLETRLRDETNFTPLVSGTSRGDVGSWTRWIPSATDINDRANNNASNAFDRYSQLTFGWSREGQTAPWYLPTFNQDNLDQRTAAAGHARDWLAGGGATDVTTDGTTHPGDGTDGFWNDGATYTNGSQGTTWPGVSTATHTATQNLEQERAPMTINQWDHLPNTERFGNFWVIDHQTGWAYWANQLRQGEATSYLLDAAEMTEAIDDTVFNGTSYYAINVESELVSPDQRSEFLNDGGNNHAALANFLEGIAIGAMHETGPNPPSHVDSAPSDFNFSTMRPGRIFTMRGEEYRYLENVGSGNHMIIRNSMIQNTNFANQETVLSNWYSDLDSDVQSIVQPVANNFVTGSVTEEELTWTGGIHWIPENLTDFPVVAADRTRYVWNGTRRAFALSLADVSHLSGPGRAFPNNWERAASAGTQMNIHFNGWITRTPAAEGLVWQIGNSSLALAGRLRGTLPVNSSFVAHGVRPALIINNQQN